MKTTIHGINYETIYDTDAEISVPIPCADDTPSINNINLSGLKFIVAKNPNNLWSQQSLADFEDFLENPPADKVFVGIGEIILSPQNNPEQYYRFVQDKNKNGKTYIRVEKLQTLSKKKKPAVKKVKAEKKPRAVKTQAKEVKPVKARKTSEKAKADKIEKQPKTRVTKTRQAKINTPKTRKRASTQQTLVGEPVPKRKDDAERINPECFFLLKMAEAMEEYCKITFPADVKKYKRMVK